jgi:antitoxin CptB
MADEEGLQELGRLRWRCRRGMRELDVLLRGYVDERYAAASSEHQEAFRSLLEAPDPVIHAYCLGLETPPTPVLVCLIGLITQARAVD